MKDAEEIIEVEFTLHELASLYQLLESLDPEKNDEFIQRMLERLNDAAMRLRKRIFGM